MVSNTAQTWKIRARRHNAMGNRRKRFMRKNGTPAFPIHPEGYDPTAPDAKPAAPDFNGQSATAKTGTDK